MVQQQLIDYIKSQIKLGVDMDSVKNALISAGWADADVADSIKSVSGAAAASGEPAFPEKEVAKASVGAAVNFGGGKQAETITPIVVSDLLSGSKIEVAAGKEKKKDEIKPFLAQGPVKNAVVPKSNKTVIVITLAVVGLAGLAGTAFFYLQSRSLSEKVLSLEDGSAAVLTKISALNSQVSALTKERDDLKSSSDSLNQKTKELLTELSFVAVPPGASSTETASFTVKGSLSGGGKIQYVLTTENGVKIYVKNYKDEKVDAALKPLVGGNVEISGTHAAGSRDVTVTGVNGSSLQ